jgi:hypothetical protein
LTYGQGRRFNLMQTLVHIALENFLVLHLSFNGLKPCFQDGCNHL